MCIARSSFSLEEEVSTDEDGNALSTSAAETRSEAFLRAGVGQEDEGDEEEGLFWDAEVTNARNVCVDVFGVVSCLAVECLCCFGGFLVSVSIRFV